MTTYECYTQTKAQHNDCIVFVMNEFSGYYFSYNQDAKTISKVVPTILFSEWSDSYPQVSAYRGEIEFVINELAKHGHKVLVVKQTN